MKRLFDIIASGMGLLILSPILIVIAIWIKLDSPGPVFYRQVRVGRNNKDFQEYEGKQYNLEYEFGGKVIEYSEDKSLIEIRNKLNVGDTMEILIPGTIDNYIFTIKELWDSETGESIETVNPGKLGQTVKLKLPIKCEKDWIIRRKKDK